MVRRALVLLALGGIAVIALLAAVKSGLKPGGPDEAHNRTTLRGPAVPAPELLSDEILFRTEDGCSSVDLATVEEVRIDARGACILMPSNGTGSSATLVLEGGVKLEEQDFLEGLRGANSEPVVVLGHDIAGDGLTAVVVERRAGKLLRERYRERSEPLPIGSAETFAAAIAFSHGGSLPELVLQLWDGSKLLEAIPLPTVGYYPVVGHSLGELVSFSPNGNELVVASGGDDGRLLVVDVAATKVALGPVRHRGFAWSPDGAWLAIASESAIDILGVTRSDPVYVLPVEARALVWQ